MTQAQTFVEELRVQTDLARSWLEEGNARQDAELEELARGRLAELEELARRNTDALQ